jgi:peptide/nickel transport system ATP-binding protein
VRQAIERPLQLVRRDLDRRGRADRLQELLADVRLDADLVDRRPHELSGGQKQRVALARAFAADPELILCDEVVSALDVSVQASILELLSRLADDRGTALLFVTHDLAVVRSVADRVCVMRDGRIVEEGSCDELFGSPQHDYTRALLDAVPRPHATASTIEAETSLGAT